MPPDQVDSRTPPALNAIIMRCLAKAPADRYQRGNDLADALLATLRPAGEAAGEQRGAWLSRRSGSALRALG